MDKCEMKVDDVVTSQKKDTVKCVLKGDASINGVPVAFKLDLITDAIDVFEKLGIDQKDSTIDVVLKESAQTSLPIGKQLPDHVRQIAARAVHQARDGDLVDIVR